MKINGKQHYLWRAVDQYGEVVDVYLQAKQDGTAAKRFFRCLLRNHGGEPRKIVTDKLRSYGVAHIEAQDSGDHLVTLTSGKELGFSRRYREHFKEALAERGKLYQNTAG